MHGKILMMLRQQPRMLLATLAIAVALGIGITGRTSSETPPESILLTGTISRVELGKPRAELILDVQGTQWLVRIGEPWRNKRAGLPMEQLVPGQKVTVQGHISANVDRQVEAARVVIDGRNYILFSGY